MNKWVVKIRENSYVDSLGRTRAGVPDTAKKYARKSVADATAKFYSGSCVVEVKPATDPNFNWEEVNQ